MRRLRFLLAATFFVAPVIAGCDSGLKEGMDTTKPADAQPASLKREMEKNAKRMQLPKSKPKMTPSAPAEKPK